MRSIELYELLLKKELNLFNGMVGVGCVKSVFESLRAINYIEKRSKLLTLNSYVLIMCFSCIKRNYGVSKMMTFHEMKKEIKRDLLTGRYRRMVDAVATLLLMPSLSDLEEVKIFNNGDYDLKFRGSRHTYCYGAADELFIESKVSELRASIVLSRVYMIGFYEKIKEYKK